MQTILIQNEPITVRTIRVKDLPRVGAAITPFIDEFNELAQGGEIARAELFKLCTRHAPHVVQLCVVMTDAEREFLNELPPKDLFELAEQVVILSQDFFLTQIAKPLNKISQTVLKLAATGLKA